MTAYYNEHDPRVAAWLRELIQAGLIATGHVDDRSILDVRPSDLSGFSQCHFFAGIGVWSYALRRAGWPDDRRVWSGSCPCQPFSQAGQGAGFDDERHLWPAWFQLIAQCQPDVIFGEQVASKDGYAWLDLVHADLEAAGYAVGASDFCAAGVGAPHIRQRLFFVGHAERTRRESGVSGDVPGEGRRGEGGLVEQPSGVAAVNGHWRDAEWVYCRDGKYRALEPGVAALAHGTAARVVRLRGYGNAICAPAAQAFIEATGLTQ